MTAEILPYDVEVCYDDNTTTIYGVNITPKEDYKFDAELISELFDHFAKPQEDTNVIGFSIKPAKEDEESMADSMSVAEFINCCDAEGGLKEGFDAGFTPYDLALTSDTKFRSIVNAAYKAYKEYAVAEDEYYSFVESAEY